MKNVPKQVLASAPKGTNWFGGSVDKIVVSLRVRPKGQTIQHNLDLNILEPLIGKIFNKQNRCWIINTRPTLRGDINKQILTLFRKLPKSKTFWNSLNDISEMDLFVGVFMERSNRGMEISAEAMMELSSRNIKLSFDIYGADF
jgi:hypothetical protein